MSVPYQVVEQYVFYYDYLGSPVHARITKTVISEKEMWDWEVNQEDGKHAFKSFSDLEGAKKSLFDYMDKFDPTKASHVPY